MNTPFTRGLSKATALTRSGKLQEATAMIQSLLNPASAGNAPDVAEKDAAIEGSFTRLDETTPEAPRAKPKARPKSGARASRLSETLRKIAAGGMTGGGPLSRGDQPQPEGAQFLSLTHVSAHGSRAYRLYVPASGGDAAMPLIVMLHGCTQSPEDFATGTKMNALAEEFRLMIAYPAQPAGANAQKCWNWYRPEDQARDHGEPALIAGIARDIQREHNADPARTYVAGLSAGAAAAVIVAAAYPDVFSAAGVHSGLPGGGAHDIPSAFSAMRSGSKGKPHEAVVPTIVFHGSADNTVHPDNGAAVLTQALTALPHRKTNVRSGASDGGRAYRTTTHHHADGRSLAEHWEIEGAGHAWAGGDPSGSYTDASGPDASREMIRFFLQHQKAKN